MIIIYLRTNSGIGRITWVIVLPVNIHETEMTYQEMVRHAILEKMVDMLTL
jgi:hypothetical protein